MLQQTDTGRILPYITHSAPPRAAESNSEIIFAADMAIGKSEYCTAIGALSPFDMFSGCNN